METISNVAASAVKAVWGDNDASKEPVSGAEGDVARGEPYDAGNLDTPKQKEIEKRLSTDQDTTTATTPAKATCPTSVTSQEQTKTETPPAIAVAKTNDAAISTATTTAPMVEATNEPVLGFKAENQPPAEHFPGSPEAKVNEHTDTQNKGSELEGDSDNNNKGTGQEYVKSTGFAAEGGDFDATKPGAGREADRLLGQTDGQQGAEAHSGSDKHTKNKPSLGERIKAKLHHKH